MRDALLPDCNRDYPPLLQGRGRDLGLLSVLLICTMHGGHGRASARESIICVSYLALALPRCTTV